jgi:hypothetical protein
VALTIEHVFTTSNEGLPDHHEQIKHKHWSELKDSAHLTTIYHICK